MALSKDQILCCQDIETRTVHVEPWGGDIILRTMNGIEREKLETQIEKFKKSGVNAKGAVRAVALVMTAVNEAGEHLFMFDDVEELAKKSGAALDCAFEHVLSMNGMSKKDAEELEKNSD